MIKYSCILLVLITCTAKSIAQKVKKADSLEWVKMNNQIADYSEKGLYDLALTLAKKGRIKAEQIFGKNHRSYAVSLTSLADIYFAKSDYKLAEPLFQSAINIYKKTTGSMHMDCASSVNDLALLYFEMGNYKEAEQLYKLAIPIFEKLLGKNDADYATILNNLAELYKTIGNFADAEPLFKTALEIRKEVLGEEDPDYAISLNNLAGLYLDMARFVEAESLYKEVLFISKKSTGENHPTYAISLNNIASLYQAMGNYALSETIHKQSLNIFKNTVGVEHIDYAMSLNNLAYLYETTGNYSDAESLYKKSLAIRNRILGKNHSDCAASYNNLAALYETLGNYSAAENMYSTAINIYKKAVGSEHPDYLKTLNNLAGLFSDMGNYAKAESIYYSTIKIRKKLLGETHPDYASSINNLATLYRAMDKYAEAEPLLKLSTSIYKKDFGEEHPVYATALNNLASFYKTMKRFTEAESLFAQAINIRKKTLGINHTDYARSLHDLAGLYVAMKKYSPAEALYLEALEINKKLFGKEHPDYANNLNKLSYLYYKSTNTEKWKELISTTIQIENANQQLLLQNFSEAEKETFLTNESEMQDIFLSMLYYFKPTDINTFYQSTTAKQGWLLHGKQLLNSWAIQSKDTVTKKLFAEWQNTNKALSVVMQLTEEKRKQNGMQLDSIQQQVQLLEKQLIKSIPALQSIISNNGITGATIAKQLKNNEAVIHWTSFKYSSPLNSTDSILYAAYIITAKDSTPKFITAFEERELKKILKSYHGASGRSTIQKENTASKNVDAALYNLIWKPLLPCLNNITTVYNLPSGLLHKVSFAALTDSINNKQLVDEYDLHQLLSISELNQHPEISNSPKSIALFGGANYDAKVNSSNKKTTIKTTAYRNASENKNIHFNYLQGTKVEVETVASNAKTINWKIETFIGNNASEDNFKQLTGNTAPTILHIATHGFYFPPTSSSKDFPLLRSGLVLSGVNNYWGKDTVLKNKEDGIITAQEISNLNLLNTDLVVLSACQTALGDINGSEGVYGLQRAFKMAGVKKLLMSLWEVPDSETAELMQLFYSNVFKGDGYYTAFRKAQLTLKAKYKDLTKWAGFVLVGE